MWQLGGMQLRFPLLSRLGGTPDNLREPCPVPSPFRQDSAVGSLTEDSRTLQALQWPVQCAAIEELPTRRHDVQRSSFRHQTVMSGMCSTLWTSSVCLCRLLDMRHWHSRDKLLCLRQILCNLILLFRLTRFVPAVSYYAWHPISLLWRIPISLLLAFL